MTLRDKVDKLMKEGSLSSNRVLRSLEHGYKNVKSGRDSGESAINALERRKKVIAKNKFRNKGRTDAEVQQANDNKRMAGKTKKSMKEGFRRSMRMDRATDRPGKTPQEKYKLSKGASEIRRKLRLKKRGPDGKGPELKGRGEDSTSLYGSDISSKPQTNYRT